MTACVAVPSSEHVAEIVGRQGSKIKALRAKTNTYIKTPVRGEEPVFVVTGRPEDVTAAKREILSASEHFSQIRASRLSAGSAGGSSPGSGGRPCPVTGLPDTSGNVTIHVRVPYRVVGLVVGPKGATIKRIQQDSGTYIVTPSRDREPVFEVTGSCDGVEKARRDIESYIALRTGTLPDTAQSSSGSLGLMQSLCGGGGPVNSDPRELDARMLLGSLLKTGPLPASSAASLMTYNNAINLGGGRFLPTEITPTAQFKLNQIDTGNGFNYDNGNNPLSVYDRYSSAAALAALSKSNNNNNNNNINLIGNGESWSNGSIDLVGANLRSLASLFPLGDDFAGYGNGLGMNGLKRDDSLGMSPLDALVASYSNHLAPSSLECCVTCPPYGGGCLVDNGSIGGGPVFNGSRRSASESSPSVSPTDSNASARRLGGCCCLCADGSVAAALVPCGHNLFCKGCADGIVTRPDPDERRCPACGESASLAIRIIS